ncbi:MAG: VWA domain-containing protein [Chloroflexi bacterium]|nr:VWA domain-containing protein [Chloroflexota bacterium]
MKTRFLFPLLLSLVMAAMLAGTVQADGIIIPHPPPDPIMPPMQQLEIRYHHVTVTIDEQIATTHVDQVFYNPNDWAIEGTYIFPLPEDAAVSSFTLWIDGEPVEGKVLDAAQARQTYEKIVRQMRDPALLEYAGRGALQASIFPIQPADERRIELEYTQALTADNGLIRYTYPLGTEKFSSQPLESVKVSVDIRSKQPIRAVYSPTHTVDIVRQDENRVKAGYEDEDVTPDKDFALYYSTGESQALHLLTYRDPDDKLDPDGFFMLMLAPQPEEEAEVSAKDVLLVLDRSGSMEGEKFQQAQAALVYILEHLNPQDRFYLTVFSTGIETYAHGLSPASDADDAVKWVGRMSAAGSTDINRALLETAAIADPERPAYLIFLTDGLPTEGVVESAQILDNFERQATNSIRLFAFGVGYDVDTFLLDSLSQEHHGLSSYVQPGEPLDEVLSGFFARISTPVLTNIELDFGDLAVYDVYPQPLPDLFAGVQVIVTGRYRKGGETDITLTGEVNGEKQTFAFEDQKFGKDTRSEDVTLSGLPRLWAARKIGYLLSQVRLHGPDQETIDQIVALSIRYGIVTEYTSYLVTEPSALGAAGQEDLARDAYQQSMAAPNVVSGQQAVEKADQEGQLAQAEIAPMVSGSGVVKTVWSRTFLLSDGVWIDTAYDPDSMETRKAVFLSDEYFALAGSREDVAAALALGERVILVIDGQAYEIVTDGESSAGFTVPESVDPDPTSQPVQEEVDAPTPAPAVMESPVVDDEPGSGLVAAIIAAGAAILLGLGVWWWRRKG